MFGGADINGKRFNDVQILAVPSFEWVYIDELKDMTHQVPQPRVGHISVVYGDKLFVFGGEDSHGNTNTLHSLDLLNFEWSLVHNFKGTPPS